MAGSIPCCVWVMEVAWPSHSISLPGERGHGVLMLTVLSALQSQKTVGKLWRDGGLSWKEFLPEDQDVNKFVTEQVGA